MWLLVLPTTTFVPLNKKLIKCFEHFVVFQSMLTVLFFKLGDYF